eukprot:scaffold185045_cov19-Tisochrysis_lutea.AAC.1
MESSPCHPPKCSSSLSPRSPLGGESLSRVARRIEYLRGQTCAGTGDTRSSRRGARSLLDGQTSERARGERRK